MVMVKIWLVEKVYSLRIYHIVSLLINSSSNIEWVDENGNITINLNETSATLHQEFRITARRKKLRRLENIAAYNVARHISGETDAEELPIAKYEYEPLLFFTNSFILFS